ncbi:hypothetical protein Hanom_Chr01g00049421 [Helianthus anomalus]
MEIDPATVDEKFVPDWDIRNKDTVMDELVARILLFNINTPLDHAKSRKMKSHDLVAVSVRENLEKETRSLKRKVLRAPDMEKKVAQLTQDFQAQQEKVKSLIAQNQSSQAAAAFSAEDRDKVLDELKSFSESMKQKDDQHKEVMAKMEVSFENAHVAYANMMAKWDVLKSGEADLKAQIEDMKRHEEELEAENTSLKARVEELQATKTWMLSEGARLLARNIHKGPEMTAAVAAVNNAMSSKKTPYSDVPMLNRNATEELNSAVACFDTLRFPEVEDLPKLIHEPLSKIKDALLFASGESPKE